MVTSQTYAFYPMFKLAAEKDEALLRFLSQAPVRAASAFK
jgi:hypothetical protein